MAKGKVFDIHLLDAKRPNIEIGSSEISEDELTIELISVAISFGEWTEGDCTLSDNDLLWKCWLGIEWEASKDEAVSNTEWRFVER